MLWYCWRTIALLMPVRSPKWLLPQMPLVPPCCCLQSVAKIVPCTALEPLVNQTMAGNTPVYVIDQGLANPSTTAYDGPVPAEPSEDSQNFYYYYEEHVDDTQVGVIPWKYTAKASKCCASTGCEAGFLCWGMVLPGRLLFVVAAPQALHLTVFVPLAQDALEVASTLAEAFLAARLGEEAESVDAVAKAIPAAVQAGVGTKSAANLTAADGPTDAPAGAFAGLRNITITRQRLGLPERRNVSVLVATGLGDMPANPAWMNTNAPGYTAGVYKR